GVSSAIRTEVLAAKVRTSVNSSEIDLLDTSPRGLATVHPDCLLRMASRRGSQNTDFTGGHTCDLRPQSPLDPRVIAKIDHSISKAALVQEIQLYAYVAGQDPLAAAKQNGHDEQVILVDEPSPDRVCGEGRTSHRNIVRQLSLEVA